MGLGFIGNLSYLEHSPIKCRHAGDVAMVHVDPSISSMEPAIAADRRGRTLHKASTASDDASDEPLGVELRGAHMLPLDPSQFHAD
jgi:hypothetical protein